MKRIIKILSNIFIFVSLTILTQIGGFVFLINEILFRKLKIKNRFKRILGFLAFYSVLTFLIVPFIALFFGREKVRHSEIIGPTNYMTVILNRNYVRPELNELLQQVENELIDTDVRIHYLDASFPFIDKFPLLPHLSHNDGKKIDLSLVYEGENGEISTEQKSITGYGIFESPKSGEFNQIGKCLSHGYFQYDFPKYLTLGEINKDLKFSEKGTKILINSILKDQRLGKLFIEPHLKERLNLINEKIRYHGCGAVRHDDHIHIQLK